MRFKWLAILGVAALVLGVGAWFGNRLLEQAHIGTAYVAKLTCSCLFVSHRPMQSCATDYDIPAARLLTEEVGNHSVTVFSPGHLVSTRAVFEQGYGCHLVN
jgi:hypothetical protein